MKPTKKTLLIGTMSFLLLFIVGTAWSALPTDLEAKALQTLENKQEWQELESQALYLQTQLQEVQDAQNQLHDENVQLEAEINTEITGLDQVQ